MYRSGRVRVNGTFSNDLVVQVGLHQGSVLGLLLFILLHENLSREIRSGCLEKLIYTDDLALVINPLDGRKGRLEVWKGRFESMISSQQAGNLPQDGIFCFVGLQKSCKHYMHLLSFLHMLGEKM